MAELAILKRHDEGARYQPGVGGHAHGMQGGAYRASRSVGGAADAAIRVSRTYHERSEVQGLARKFAGFHFRHALGFATVSEQ